MSAHDILTYMRQRDVDAFKAAAKVYKVYILVRRTNPHSLQYIGLSGYVPKPLDCKPKTADRDAVVKGKRYKTEGLVVDPTIVGAAAYKPGKFEKAMAAWKKFAGFQPPPAPGVKKPLYLSANKSYTVQTDSDHKHYGCIMWSPTQLATAGKYVHGDYDLYAIVPADKPIETVFVEEQRMGQHHARGKELLDVQTFVNSRIGVPMVRHGDQEKYDQHSDEEVDLFFPDGRVDTLRNKAEIATCYAELFKGRKTGGHGVATERAGGLWKKVT